jgi:hypothetical protein
VFFDYSNFFRYKINPKLIPLLQMPVSQQEETQRKKTGELLIINPILDPAFTLQSKKLTQ